MENKNILLIGPLPPKLGGKIHGGVAKVVWELAKSLNQANVDVKVAGIGKYFKKYQRIKGIDIYGIGFSLFSIVETLIVLVTSTKEWYKNVSFNNFCRLAYSVYYLSYIGRKLDFDVIHVHHVLNQIPLAAKILGIEAKIIATVHSYTRLIGEEDQKDFRLRQSNVNVQLKAIKYLTHVSNSVRQQGISLGVEWNCRDRIVYNGLDIKKLRGFKNDRKPKNYICFVGWLVERKGIRELLECFQLLGDEDLELKIIGNVMDNGTLKNEVLQLANEGVEYVGTLNNFEVLKYMANSKALIVPSKSESFGLVYIEALMVGTPVIGYSSILHEFKEELALNDYLGKWLVEFDYQTDTVKSLANKTEEIITLKNNNNYSNEKNEIRNIIEYNFNWQKISEEYRKIYDIV